MSVFLFRLPHSPPENSPNNDGFSAPTGWSDRNFEKH